MAGDAMDLTLLARALTDRNGERRHRIALTTLAIAGITAVDVLAAVRIGRARRARAR
ncbi:hypothetical protein NKG94_07450 [Micromonospora sp. M12]